MDRALLRKTQAGFLCIDQRIRQHGSTMPISHSIWRVGRSPSRLPEAILPSEQLLEEMIVAFPEILSDQWMIIGRQEITGYGGRIDLLAIAPDSSLILIELKRSRTPREVVAQAIDYASWIEQLTPDQIQAIYSRFKEGGDLKADDVAPLA